MLAIITIFVAGVLTMFSSFLSYRKLPRIIGLIGIAVAFVTILLRKEFALHFIEFYSWNPVSIYMTVLALFVAFFIFLNYPEPEDLDAKSGVYSLLLFSLCGAFILFGFTNLISLFLGIEIMSIPVYVLAASNKEDRFSLEAGLKYFILGSFSSAILLFGIALIYGTFGSFFVAKIIEVQKMGIPLPAFYHIGVLFVFIGIFFKMALAPFHFWSPDVYDGAPHMITGYMATIVKMGATISLYYLGSGFFAFSGSQWVPVVIIIVGLSLLLGGILGIVQTNVKRIMAYSGITNAAFLTMTVLIALLFQNHTIIRFYLFVYSIAILLIFTILSRMKVSGELTLDALSGLMKKDKMAGIGILVAVLSLAGIPATGGFIAKYSVLSTIYSMNLTVFLLAILASAIAIVYYLKLVHQVCIAEVGTYSADIKVDFGFYATVAIGIILLVLAGFFPTLILENLAKLL